MTPIRGLLVVAGVLIVAGLGMAAETNILSFSYNTSLAADASTPDTWGRKLNDGCWTNVASDGVRYTGDVAVTLDLARRTQISRVDVYTFPSGGASPLSTQGVTLEGSHDAAAWIALGALSAVSNGLFSGHAFFMNARYLRVTCAKGSGAVGQSLAEIVVAGTSASASGLLSFTYSTSMPYNTAHTDPSMVKLCDGSWTNAGTQSVQYGPGTLAAVNTSDPASCIASNVVVVTTLSGVRTLRGASLLAFRSTGSGGYATSRVTLSNSLDGVTWSCAGVQTNVESSFPGYYAPNSVRFDFTLPNVDARYLAFACEKISTTNIVRQLLGEIQISETPAAVFLGDPLAFTYEFSKAPSVHVDRTDSPKLTDGAWDSNTRNAVRIYGDFSITADLGTPRYVAGTDLLCWSNNFSQESGTYSTGRVVVNGSLDKTNWIQVADITRWSPSWPYHHAVTFSNSMPFARYLRFDAYRCADTDSTTNTAQIMGELTIYRPPSAVVGALPVEATNAIQNAGFEDAQIQDGDSATMLVKGGVTNGWTFSYASSANYAGFQRNNSPVSTNYPSTGYSSRYFASEGKQTAVLLGSGSMETQISVPTNGVYALQFLVNSTVISSTTEAGGYDFRIRLDGDEKGVVTVQQLTNTLQEVLLSNVSAGAHTLRFEGVNSKSLTWGALVDNLKLKRYAVTAEQVSAQERGFVFVGGSMTPLELGYAGDLQVKELWLDGVLMPPAKYSAASNSEMFEGPGAIRYNRGTVFQVM